MRGALYLIFFAPVRFRLLKQHKFNQINGVVWGEGFFHGMPPAFFLKSLALEHNRLSIKIKYLCDWFWVNEPQAAEPGTWPLSNNLSSRVLPRLTSLRIYKAVSIFEGGKQLIE